MPKKIGLIHRTRAELEQMLAEADKEVARMHKVRANILNVLRKDESNKTIRCKHCWFKTTPADAQTCYSKVISWGYEEDQVVFQCPNCKHLSLAEGNNDYTPPASDWKEVL